MTDFARRHANLLDAVPLEREEEQRYALAAQDALTYGGAILQQHPSLFSTLLPPRYGYSWFRSIFVSKDGEGKTGYDEYALLVDACRNGEDLQEHGTVLTALLEKVRPRGTALLLMLEDRVSGDLIAQDGRLTGTPYRNVVSQYVEARDRIVNGSLRGVAEAAINIANHYTAMLHRYGSRDELEDLLFNKGAEFINKSVDRFDPARGVKFYTFIRNGMRHRLHRESHEYFKQEMKITQETSSSNPLEDQTSVEPDKLLIENEQLQAFREALTVLTPLEREVVLLRQENDNLADIGRKVGRSRERVRQLEKRAMEKIRSRLASIYGPGFFHQF